MSRRERKFVRKILYRAYERMRGTKRTYPNDADWYTNGIATIQAMIAWTDDFARS